MSSYDIKKITSLLKVISDNSRLQILSTLMRGEQCVCQLIDQVKLSQSLISHHLKDLKESGLVTDRKEGKWSYYSLTEKGKQIINLIVRMNV